ncbi:UNVERIFIED_ORG: hypothetical protein J2Y81_008085 [Paraburkholderia sediminicola]|nr:hypothetical protein [Paraburkholderia sediminicola]
MALDPVAGRTDQPPDVLRVIDDVLTAGAHYAADARKLRDVFPNVPVYESFIARRAIPNPFAEIANDF